MPPGKFSNLFFSPHLVSPLRTQGLLYMRDREAEMRNLQEATNGRVAWLSILSLLVCAGLAVWQVLYLKAFFERKKLL